MLLASSGRMVSIPQVFSMLSEGLQDGFENVRTRSEIVGKGGEVGHIYLSTSELLTAMPRGMKFDSSGM